MLLVFTNNFLILTRTYAIIIKGIIIISTIILGFWLDNSLNSLTIKLFFELNFTFDKDNYDFDKKIINNQTHFYKQYLNNIFDRSSPTISNFAFLYRLLNFNNVGIVKITSPILDNVIKRILFSCFVFFIYFRTDLYLS